MVPPLGWHHENSYKDVIFCFDVNCSTILSFTYSALCFCDFVSLWLLMLRVTLLRLLGYFGLTLICNIHVRQINAVKSRLSEHPVVVSRILGQGGQIGQTKYLGSPPRRLL